MATPLDTAGASPAAGAPDPLVLAEQLPPPAELNRQLAESLRRVALLRTLLRVARVRDSYARTDAAGSPTQAVRTGGRHV